MPRTQFLNTFRMPPGFEKNHHFKNHRTLFKINLWLPASVSGEAVPGPPESVMTACAQHPEPTAPRTFREAVPFHELPGTQTLAG